MTPQLPLEPLLRRPEVRGNFSPTSTALNMSAAALRLGVRRERLYVLRRRGLTVWEGDELACRVGLHPSAVWPDFHDLEEAG